MSGLFSAVSGIRANQTSLNVISNNLSNLNTLAFKASTVNYQTVHVQTLSGGTIPSGSSGGINPTQIGNGTSVAEIQQNFTPGGNKYTGRSSDLSINGEGFFTIQGPSNSSILTRAGNFSLDALGSLNTSSGSHVLGTATVNGDNLAEVKPVRIPPTLTIYKEIRTSDKSVVKTTIDNTASSPPSTSVSGTTIQRQDVGLLNYAIGGDGAITATYTNGDRITVRTDPTDTTKREIYHLTAEGTAFSVSGSGTTGTTTIAHNALYPAELQLRMATVTNPAGLVQTDGTAYEIGGNVGSVSMGIGNTNGRGSIAAGSLETSNVDLSTEFTNLIISQRGLEAASKAVSTESDIMQTIIGIVR